MEPVPSARKRTGNHANPPASTPGGFAHSGKPAMSSPFRHHPIHPPYRG